MYVYKKIHVSYLLIACMVFIVACSNGAEDNDEAINDQANDVSSNENVEVDEEKDNQNSSEMEIEEDEEVTSEFVITETSINSVYFKSSTDVGSEFDKEVMETLSDFDAESTDDGAKLTLPEDILFDFDSATLPSEADEAIQQLVQVIETTEEDDEVSITGHTDSKGDDDYNQELSEDRAKAVLEALSDEGIDKDRINAEGKGAEDPVAQNTNSDGSDNSEGRQENRRVEVTIHGFNQ